MTPEQFEMIEQTMLDIHNETVVQIAEFVRHRATPELASLIRKTFLFNTLNDLRTNRQADIVNIETAKTTQIS